MDDGILEQSEAKKANWLRWGTVAACLCLFILGAVSLFHIKGSSQNNKQPLAVLAFNGGYYEVCDTDWVLEKYGLPCKLTAEMAGERLAYLKHDGGAGYEETAAQTDIALYQYAPSPCRGVYVVRDGESYKAALFCNFRLVDRNDNVELSALYHVYGLSGAGDIASIARTRGEREAAAGSIVTASEAVASFYALTASLESCGNDDFQAAVFDGIPEEEQPAAHTAFADDAFSVRIELKTGLCFYLRIFPSYNWIYGPGTLSYYRMDEGISDWFEGYLH